MSELVIEGLTKRYGVTEVLTGIDLHVPDGSFTVFVGPSGCGKSTLLRLICGLDEVTKGRIAIDGEIINDVPSSKRGIAMVFQSYALYPHMTVAQNMGYALSLAKAPKAEIESRVARAAAILKIEPLLARKPRQLSGGQRQRVAIGRAIVREPKIFLFDEPLSNLDAALRVDMRMEFARLKARLGATMVYVTHDQVEAMTLADQIVVMNAGRIEQVGAPLDLYERPVNRFVAGFIGSPRMNFLDVAADEGGLVVAGRRMRMAGLPRGVRELGVRPEHLRLAREGEAWLEGRLLTTEALGSDTFAHVELEGVERPLVARLGGTARLAAGQPVGLVPETAHLHLFDGEGRALGRPARAPEWVAVG
jgi:ABC-type sugar transport system ATPase subunit